MPASKRACESVPAGGAGGAPPPPPPPAESDEAYELRLKLTHVNGLVALNGYAREADACAGLSRETWRCIPAGLSAADADSVRRDHQLWQAIINLQHAKWPKMTRLMLAVEHGAYASVEDLVAWRADLEAKDDEGSTALSWACCVPDGEMSGFVLVNAGANVNAVGYINCHHSVLMHACGTGKARLVRHMLKAGADKSYSASDHKKAVDVINSLYMGDFRKEIRAAIVDALNAA